MYFPPDVYATKNKYHWQYDIKVTVQCVIDIGPTRWH